MGKHVLSMGVSLDGLVARAGRQRAGGPGLPSEGPAVPNAPTVVSDRRCEMRSIVQWVGISQSLASRSDHVSSGLR